MGTYQVELDDGSVYEVDVDEGENNSNNQGVDFSGEFRPAHFAKQGLQDLPKNAVQMAKEAYNFAGKAISNPIDAFTNVKADTYGTLGAGGLGATAGGYLGSMAGVPFAPFTAGLSVPIVGAIGAGLGFAGGLLGYDVSKDSVDSIIDKVLGYDSGTKQPTWSERGNKFAYDATQGAAFDLPIRAVGGALNKGGEALRPYTKEGQKIIAGNRILEASGDPTLANKIELEALNQLIEPDPFLPYKTIGEITDNTGLKNLQRTMEQTRSPEATAKLKNISKGRDDARLNFLDDIEKSSFDAEATQDILRNKIDAIQQMQESVVDRARVKSEKALSQLPERIEPEAAGDIIGQNVRSQYEQARGRTREAFDSLPLESGKVDLANVQAPVADSINKYFGEGTSGIPSEISSLVQRIGREAESSLIIDPITNTPAKTTLPLATLKETQNIISDAIRVVKNSDNQKAVAVARDIIENLDNSIQNAGEAGLIPTETYSRWKEAKGLRNEQGRIFERSSSKKVIDKGNYTNEVTPPSSVPEVYFKNNSSKGALESMQNFKEATGGSLDAMEAMYRHIASKFRLEATDANGLISPRKASSWIQRHSQALKEVPELKTTLQDSATAQKMLDDTFGRLERSSAEIKKSAFQQFVEVDPDKAIGAMLSGGKRLAKTKAIVKLIRNDPDALGGFRKSFIDHIKSTSFDEGTGVFSEAKYKKTIEGLRNDRVNILKEVFSEDQLKALDILYKDALSEQSIQKSAIIHGSQTAPLKASVDNLTSSTLAAIKRFTIKSIVRTPFLGDVVNFLGDKLSRMPAARVNELIEEAILFDPKLATELVQKATNERLTRNITKIFGKEINLPNAPTIPGVLIRTTRRGADERGSLPKPTTQSIEKVTSEKSFPTPEELKKPSKTSLKDGKYDTSSLPPDIRAMIETESQGNPYAVSQKGAKGLMQLMPSTAKAYGVTDPFDPEQNIMGGLSNYRDELKRFGDPVLARYAYNAGSPKVLEAIRLAGTKQPDKVAQFLEPETVQYNQKIEDLIKKYSIKKP